MKPKDTIFETISGKHLSLDINGEHAIVRYDGEAFALVYPLPSSTQLESAEIVFESLKAAFDEMAYVRERLRIYMAEADGSN